MQPVGLDRQLGVTLTAKRHNAVLIRVELDFRAIIDNRE